MHNAQCIHRVTITSLQCVCIHKYVIHTTKQGGSRVVEHPWHSCKVSHQSIDIRGVAWASWRIPIYPNECIQPYIY